MPETSKRGKESLGEGEHLCDLGTMPILQGDLLGHLEDP